MNKIVICILVLLSLFISIPTAFADDVYVQGYTKRDGTYVKPHYRSAPDSNQNNNWSTRGNTNPYTGERGTKSPSPSYGSDNLNGGGSLTPNYRSPGSSLEGNSDLYDDFR